MIEVTKFYVRSYDLDHLNVFWQIKDTQDDIQAFDMYLYRSESPNGIWQLVAGPFNNQYLFRDYTSASRHKLRKIFYKLKIVDKRSNETVEFGPTAQIPEPDLVALEIVRQEDVLFREFIGTRCIVFPVKTFGQFCASCYNKVSKRVEKSNCMTCYGTGYLGGYWSPVSCFIQIDPSPKNIQLGPTIEQYPFVTTGRMINFPPMNPRDIIVDSENKRWIVITVAPTKKFGHPVHQELTVKQLLTSDMAYKLPINIDDITTFEVVAERNFTNPQTLQQDPEKSYRNKPRGTTY